MKRLAFAAILAIASSFQGCGRPAAQRPAPAAHPESRPTAAALPAAFEQTIPGATATLHMRPVPPVAAGKPAFFMSASEITWDVYDAFALRLDEPENKAADAITRPSKPYIPPDYGFGHSGYAAMSITFEAACRFCDWLSKKTGRRYRLPTEAEWEHAARAGAVTAWCCGDDPAALVDYAWFGANAEDVTRPVCSKKPNAWGFYDLHGNVAEWCTTADLQATTCGGSFRDDPADLKFSSRAPYSDAWQRRDPQLPKSPWWLSDGPFVGFRVVTEVETPRR